MTAQVISSGEPQLEPLFIHPGAPGNPGMLFNELETVLPVQVPGGAQALKTPQIHPLVFPAPAEVDGGFHQPASYTVYLPVFSDNKPAEVSSQRCAVDSINGNRTFDAPIDGNNPEAVPVFIVPADEFGKLGRNFSFEISAKAPVPGVVLTVKLGYPADRARHVAFYYIYDWHLIVVIF